LGKIVHVSSHSAIRVSESFIYRTSPSNREAKLMNLR